AREGNRRIHSGLVRDQRYQGRAPGCCRRPPQCCRRHQGRRHGTESWLQRPHRYELTGTRGGLRMGANMESDAELKGRIVGNKVQGLGISNMKGGLASFMVAGKALKKSGIKLKGD